MGKKVLVLNPYLPTLGGGEKYMGILCQFMEQYFTEGVFIDILVFNYNDIDVEDSNYVTIDALNKQYGLNLSKTGIRKIFRSQNAMYDNLDDYVSDITQEYDLFINFMIFSKLIPKARKSVYLCMFPPRTREMENNKKTALYKLKMKWLDRKFLRSYDKFIVISEYSNHWFNQFWGIGHNTCVIYPPVFTESELNGRYNESKKENIIISVGRFFVDAHSKKQLEMVQFFVDHLDIFKTYEYHLVGAVSNYPKDQEYLKQIKKIAKETNNVYIHENCKFNVLMDLYMRAKIFWHATGLGIDGNQEPEKMEHFGITTVEAMSFGAVPVVINKGGQKETVEDGVNGYLWDTERECIEKTEKLINDDTLRKEMAFKSYRKAKNYSVDEFYNRNRVVFNELRV